MATHPHGPVRNGVEMPSGSLLASAAHASSGHPKGKPHWTQTPEGRERMRQIQTERAKTPKGRAIMRKAQKKAMLVIALKKKQGVSLTESSNGDLNGHQRTEEAAIISFLAGQCKGIIATYAEGIGVPSAALAFRVGEVLQRASRRKGMGTLDHLSPL